MVDAKKAKVRSIDQELQDLLKHIVGSLIDFPEDAEVSVVPGESTCILQIGVRKEEVGKIIGKQGHTAQAIRTILGAVGTKFGRRILVEVLDQD